MPTLDALPLDDISLMRQRLEAAERENARLTEENAKLSARCTLLGSLELISFGSSQTVADLVHFLEIAPTECTIELKDILSEMGSSRSEPEAASHASH